MYYFKGPTTLGSLRDIRLIRNENQIISIDFYDYLLKGKKLKDEKLQLDDIVFIPQRGKTIHVDGEINRPGIYELKSSETLEDLLLIAGGVKATAYLKRAMLDRIVPFEDRASEGMDRMFIDVNLDSILNTEEDFYMKDGDKLHIFSVMEMRQNAVKLEGAVSRPGVYTLEEGLTLKDLILKADSLLGDAYLERVDVVRLRSDFTEELIKLDLKKVLLEDKESNILLQGSDNVRVYGMTEMVPNKYVAINGHVKKPGRYLLKKNMTLYDLIFFAGGFVDEEFKKLTYLERAELIRIAKDSDEKEIIPFNLEALLSKKEFSSMPLKANDKVIVYSLNDIIGGSSFVTISGRVKRPGRYELFEENMTIKDLLFKAGGFNDPEFRAEVFFKRADLYRFEKIELQKLLSRLI